MLKHKKSLVESLKKLRESVDPEEVFYVKDSKPVVKALMSAIKKVLPSDWVVDSDEGSSRSGPAVIIVTSNENDGELYVGYGELSFDYSEDDEGKPYSEELCCWPYEASGKLNKVCPWGDTLGVEIERSEWNGKTFSGSGFSRMIEDLKKMVADYNSLKS